MIHPNPIIHAEPGVPWAGDRYIMHKRQAQAHHCLEDTTVVLLLSGIYR
jgi:hypothetical protein